MMVTPPVNITGEFSVLPPFELTVNMIYKCHAVRTIDELLAKGMDVYGEFYKPKNVPYSRYQEDHKKKGSIVTLLSAEDQYVYVPNSYIASYPGMSGIPYSHKVIFIELGMIPDAVDTSYLVPLLHDVVTHATGVAATPQVGVVPYIGSISHEKHIDLERTRRVAIQNYTPLQEQVRDLKASLDAANKTIKDLTAVIAAHPELSTPTQKK